MTATNVSVRFRQSFVSGSSFSSSSMLFLMDLSLSLAFSCKWSSLWSLDMVLFSTFVCASNCDRGNWPNSLSPSLRVNLNALVSKPLPPCLFVWTVNILKLWEAFNERLVKLKGSSRVQLVWLLSTNSELSICRWLCSLTFFLIRLCRIDSLSRGFGNTKRTDASLICVWNSRLKYSFLPRGDKTSRLVFPPIFWNLSAVFCATSLGCAPEEVNWQPADPC